ncbi:MAG: 6,7-dimethyl-8-ribityllumazine synthase, partial [Porticoccus sp.]
FEYICGETTRGIAQVTLQENLPIGFGLLTTNDLEQSELRSGVLFNDSGNENKGKEAALTVLEMISLFSKLGSL